jgi:hypothetical protein
LCGLFGFYGLHMPKDDKEKLHDLAILSTLRGEDSTGAIIGWKKKNKGRKIRVNYRKEVTNPTSFMRHPDTQHMLNANDTFLFAGHSRQATVGHVNYQNAHPIEEGDIVGTHNGTIGAFRPSTSKEAEHSDSRELFRRINSRGLQKAVTEANGGAMALAFVDRRARTFNLFRNKDRPLYLMWQQNGFRFLYASEYWMLETVRDRAWGPKDYKDPVALEPGKLLTFELGSIHEKWTTIDIEKKPFITVPQIFSHAPSTSKSIDTTGRDIPWNDKYKEWDGVLADFNANEEDDSQNLQDWLKDCKDESEQANAARANEVILLEQKTEARKKIETATTRIISDGSKIYRFYKYYQGRIVSLKNAEKLLERGCEISGKIADVDDDIIWIGEQNYIFPEYRDDPLYKEYYAGVTEEYRSKLL